MSSKRMSLTGFDVHGPPRKPVFHDFEMEYATREAREASFAPPTKRSKAGWPHKTPTPADLAKAGFFYSPTTSKDNVECFICGRHLDGWEEDDDALQEHIKHSPECAWAQLITIEQESEYDTSNMEDPTGSQLTEARRKTFTAIGWPHESKRSWTCKTEKMVEAGWHFAPVSECEDYVSCVYCKLSLDGWEPKDNPFEEHYRRSPQCQFFVFAGTTAPSKRPKAKKSRASRTSKASSRLSTQSNTTILSQAESIPDLDQSIDGSADNSQISIMSTASTATTKGKRKASSRAKSTKTKKPKTTRGKKKQVEPEPESEAETQEAQLVELSQGSAKPNYSVVLDASEMDRFERFETPAEGFEKDEIVQIEEDTPRAELEVDIEEEPLGPPETQEPAIPAQTESPLRRQKKQSLTEKSPQLPPMKQSKQRKSSIKAKAHRSPSQSPPNLSDTENAPPSSLPSSSRPPLSSPGAPQPQWSPVDVDLVFMATPVAELFKKQGKEAAAQQLSEKEQQMTVQDWIEHVAGQAEEDLKTEGERVVSVFEKEGQRALTVLESIVCV